MFSVSKGNFNMTYDMDPSDGIDQTDFAVNFNNVCTRM